MTAPAQPLQVLVTRPEPQATLWAQDLVREGFAAHALPLIDITGPSDPGPVQALWHHMAAHKILMFVSPAAVQWFFQLRPEGLNWAPQTLAAAPGPGTARSLLTVGEALGLKRDMIMSPGLEAEQFDSEALWPLLAPLDWQGQHVSIISGGDDNETKGRTWLAEQWRAQGAQVCPLLTYQRCPSQWGSTQQGLARQALAAPDSYVWLFSSSQAIDHMQNHHVPQLGLAQAPPWPLLRAVVTHPKIAERARQLGIERITSTRPTLAAVVQALRTAR